MLFNLINKKSKFVLLSTQRSGSTLLLEYLMSHPDIYMARELFKISGEGRNVDIDGYRDSDLTIAAYLDKFYKLRCKDYQVVGFKLMIDQLERFPVILDYLQRNSIRCIYMERRNILKTYISRLTARRDQIYHVEDKVHRTPLLMPLDTIENDLQEIRSTLDKASSLISGLNCHTVYYEDMLENPTKLLEEIQHFLQVNKPRELTAVLKKLNDDDLNYTIVNYAELYSHFSKCEDYAKYLTPLKVFPLPFKNINDLYHCIFLHIPKVAGSSIEKALFGCKGKVGHCYARQYQEADAEKFKQYFSFAFVRNPYDRLVSAYCYLRMGGRNKFDSAWASENIQHYRSFEEFVLSLLNQSVREKILSWMHFKPQYLFVCDLQGNIIVDFVGRYETLNEDFAQVIKTLGINTQLFHDNPSKRRGYEHYYNKATKNVVRKVYAQDFELFGYEA